MEKCSALRRPGVNKASTYAQFPAVSVCSVTQGSEDESKAVDGSERADTGAVHVVPCTCRQDVRNAVQLLTEPAQCQLTRDALPRCVVR